VYSHMAQNEMRAYLGIRSERQNWIWGIGNTKLLSRGHLDSSLLVEKQRGDPFAVPSRMGSELHSGVGSGDLSRADD